MLKFIVFCTDGHKEYKKYWKLNEIRGGFEGKWAILSGEVIYLVYILDVEIWIFFKMAYLRFY